MKEAFGLFGNVVPPPFFFYRRISEDALPFCQWCGFPEHLLWPIPQVLGVLTSVFSSSAPPGGSPHHMRCGDAVRCSDAVRCGALSLSSHFIRASAPLSAISRTHMRIHPLSFVTILLVVVVVAHLSDSFLPLVLGSAGSFHLCFL